MVIHTRSADDDTFELLEEHALGVNVILHCFSMADRIAECLAHPEWWISFAGNVTYPKNATLMDAALRVPAHRLLVETDAPYLAPQKRRGRPNSPAQVALDRPGDRARPAHRVRRTGRDRRELRHRRLRLVRRRGRAPAPQLCFVCVI